MLQELTSEREKPREKIISPMIEKKVGGDAERARCVLDNHRQNSEVLSNSLLSSELLRASTEKVSYLFS